MINTQNYTMPETEQRNASLALGSTPNLFDVVYDPIKTSKEKIFLNY